MADNFATLIDLLVQAEFEGRPRHEYTVNIGDTPGYLVDHAGLPRLPMLTTGKVVGKICFDHGIGKPTLKRLPGILASPRAVFRPADARHGNSVVVVTLETHRRGPVIIPIKKGVLVGRRRCNMVASMYAKEGPNPLKKWKKQGLLIWQPK